MRRVPPEKLRPLSKPTEYGVVFVHCTEMVLVVSTLAASTLCDPNAMLPAPIVQPATMVTETVKDAGGTPIIRNLIAIPDRGWISYSWPNPISHKVEAKVAYIIAIGDTRLGVGAYK